ncbi:ROK family protein [Paucibacter sp. APW11]|uniref:ROK family protein n=1 Tax=Roseateles aquae TaxID=3077235 RepID=A0ABU3PH67_9BURK|nr:ROK family protein [Paucibacter sp. APW11]MDT9001745.1 ROK family protein [Paucibacter sp. APW11]
MTLPSPSQAPRNLLLADIGGSHLRIARLRPDHGCELLADLPTPTQNWPQFCAALKQALQPHAAPGAPGAALSISITGLVSPESGKVDAANLPCLNGRPLASELSALLGMPVVVSNDAQCAALAEARLGVGRGHAVVFCAVLGTGVGGGLVVNGQWVRGGGGLGGEWGHGPVVNEALLERADGQRLRLPRFACSCGQSGCVDTIGGARGLERLHGWLQAKQTQAQFDSRQILQAWLSGDAGAAATVAAYLELIAGPLAMVVNFSGASVVPVCGGLSRCPELVAALDQAVRQRILRRDDQPLLRPSTLNDQAGLIGAACAYEQLRMERVRE